MYMHSPCSQHQMMFGNQLPWHWAESRCPRPRLLGCHRRSSDFQVLLKKLSLCTEYCALENEICWFPHDLISSSTDQVEQRKEPRRQGRRKAVAALGPFFMRLLITKQTDDSMYENWSNTGCASFYLSGGKSGKANFLSCGVEGTRLWMSLEQLTDVA